MKSTAKSALGITTTMGTTANTTAGPKTPPDSEASANRAVPLKRNFAWTLAGNVTYAVCQWGIFLVLARLGSPGMVGQFALGFAIANPVILLSQLQLRSLQATDASHAEYRPGD